MSESEQQNALGVLVERHGELDRELKEMEGEFRKLSDAFSALGSALATRANHALSDVQKAHRTISELPAELTPAMLRGMVEKYSKLAGEWTSIRKQLEGYGL